MLNPLLARAKFFRRAEQVVKLVAPDFLYLEERDKFNVARKARASGATAPVSTFN
jgi:hypothetical protein